jgi:hypothetical protein
MENEDSDEVSDLEEESLSNLGKEEELDIDDYQRFKA